MEFQELWNNRMKNYKVDDCKYYDALTNKIITIEEMIKIAHEIGTINAYYRFIKLPFTGYSDKNNNKIYLNDILLLEDMKCVVFFINYQFRLSPLNVKDGIEIVTFDSVMQSDAKNYIEIIGNTYVK